jgi:hypothetical protein
VAGRVLPGEDAFCEACGTSASGAWEWRGSRVPVPSTTTSYSGAISSMMGKVVVRAVVCSVEKKLWA